MQTDLILAYIFKCIELDLALGLFLEGDENISAYILRSLNFFISPMVFTHLDLRPQYDELMAVLDFIIKELEFTGVCDARMSKQGFKENIYGIYRDFKHCSTISYRLK